MGEGVTYFVGFVVVLRVVFEDLRFLGVLEGVHEVVRAKFLAPLLVVDEPGVSCQPSRRRGRAGDVHLFAEFNIELAGSQKAE